MRSPGRRFVSTVALALTAGGLGIGALAPSVALGNEGDPPIGFNDNSGGGLAAGNVPLDAADGTRDVCIIAADDQSGGYGDDCIIAN